MSHLPLKRGLTSLLTVLVWAPCAFSQTAPALQWNARGMEAVQKLERLKKQIADLSQQQESAQEKQRLTCEAILEEAYALHVTRQSDVHKQSGPIEHFTLLLMRSQEDVARIIYPYLEQALGAVIITHLPQGWTVEVASSAPEIVVHIRQECSFVLNTQDPLRGKVLFP